MKEHNYLPHPKIHLFALVATIFFNLTRDLLHLIGRDYDLIYVRHAHESLGECWFNYGPTSQAVLNNKPAVWVGAGSDRVNYVIFFCGFFS